MKKLFGEGVNTVAKAFPFTPKPEPQPMANAPIPEPVPTPTPRGAEGTAAQILGEIILGALAQPPQPTPTPTVPPVAPSIPNPIPTPTPPPVYPDQQLRPDIQQFLDERLLPITREQGIPDALAASQWAQESGRATESPINNFYGLGGTKPIAYPDFETGIEAYATTVENILAAKGYTLEDFAQDPYGILMRLQEGERPRYEGHNADPYAYTQNIMHTPEWRRYFGR